MFELLNRNSKRLYSFGQILESSHGQYTVSYKEIQIRIVTHLEFEIGDWVIFYGKFKKDILNVKFIEKLTGVNVQLLERIANYLNKISL